MALTDHRVEATTAAAARGRVRREDLLDAAVAVIRTSGPDASMNDIAAAAAVTKPVLYQHFRSKAGLAAALADRYLAGLTDELGPILTADTPPDAALRTGIELLVGFATGEPGVFRFLAEGALGTGRAANELPMVTALAGMLSDYLAVSTEPSGRRRADTWAIAIMGMVISTIDWWSATGGHDPELLVDDLLALCLEGINAPTGDRRR